MAVYVGLMERLLSGKTKIDPAAGERRGEA